MPNIQTCLCAFALALVAFASPGLAQQSTPDVAADAGLQCGGQYECLEIRLLTPEEARASRAFKQIAQVEQPATVAALEQRAVANAVK
jgi:hypothetical protein